MNNNQNNSCFLRRWWENIQVAHNTNITCKHKYQRTISRASNKTSTNNTEKKIIKINQDIFLWCKTKNTKFVCDNLLCEIGKFPQTESATIVHLVESQFRSFRVQPRPPVKSMLYGNHLHPKKFIHNCCVMWISLKQPLQSGEYDLLQQRVYTSTKGVQVF